MIHEFGALDATLAAAAGDDLDLQGEIRAAFIASVKQQIDLLARARCDGNWLVAAMRLRGLAASFHARELYDLAEKAAQAVPSDPVILREIRAHAAELERRMTGS